MTGYIYDKSSAEHAQTGHAEHPGRLDAVMASLAERGLLDRLESQPLRLATGDELMAVHTLSMLDMTQRVCVAGGGHLDADTYTRKSSLQISRRAGGGLIDLCASVATGELDNGLALIRPPGHHATRNRAMGFCLTNHVAVAAESLRQRADINRVAIVDFDGHHGNGTADIFTADADVLFISTHQYPHFPGTGTALEMGQGPGLGTTINIPLPAGTGDQGFIDIYQRVVWPGLRRFQPDFILVSAGYDAHRNDRLVHLDLSTEGYAWLSSQLIAAAAELCHGRIVFSLEGGYDLLALPACVCDTVECLLAPDSDVAMPTGLADGPDLGPLLDQVVQLHGL